MLNINKNFGISKATGDWILYLDDDEVVPIELAKELRDIADSSNEDKDTAPLGYWIGRKNIIFGKWIEHGIWWPDAQLRFFKKGHGEYPAIHVHEHLDVSGPTGKLEHPYIHYNYDSISQFLWKMETIYTESEVAKLVTSGYTVRWYDAVRFPISDFVKLYLAQGGYKDGLHGLVLAILQSFYSFIVFAKLWEREGFSQSDISLRSFEKEFAHSHSELKYWLLTEKINHTRYWLTKIILKVQRKWYRV